MNITKKMIAGFSFLVMGVGSSAALADVVVVVSAKSPATSITSEQAADIFLGRTSALPSGEQAIPVDQTEGSTVRDELYTKVVGKTPAQVKAYWSKQIFSGKGQPPKVVGDNAGVKNLIANNPNLIGYIDKSAMDASVKALLTSN